MSDFAHIVSAITGGADTIVKYYTELCSVPPCLMNTLLSTRECVLVDLYANYMHMTMYLCI